MRQANIAQVHQQVNNLPEKNITPQNELLGDDYAKLDRRATPVAKGVNPTLEALDEVNRGKNWGRQEKVIQKLIEDR